MHVRKSYAPRRRLHFDALFFTLALGFTALRRRDFGRKCDATTSLNADAASKICSENPLGSENKEKNMQVAAAMPSVLPFMAVIKNATF